VGTAPDDLGEALLVTARRVEEDVQEVPGSVQTLPGDLLDQLDSTRLYELHFNE
jgi:hypothetical protein